VVESERGTSEGIETTSGDFPGSSELTDSRGLDTACSQSSLPYSTGNNAQGLLRNWNTF